MVQNSEYIDYQQLNPSRLQPESVQDRCKLGAETEGEVIIVHHQRGVIDWDQLRRTWVKTHKARKLMLYGVLILSGVAVVFVVMYRIGLWVVAVVQHLGELFIQALPAIGACAAFLLLILIVVYVVKNNKSARPFDDWTPKDKDKPTTTSGRPIVINQIVNVNDK